MPLAWADLKKSPVEADAPITRSQRSHEDAKAAEGIGIAERREEERALAVTGQQDFAPSLFDHQESVLNAGVLFSIPALASQELNKVFEVFKPLPNGFYGFYGLVRDFYRERMIRVLEALRNGTPFDKVAWELKWVESSGISEVEPFNDPLGAARELVNGTLNP